MTVRKRMIDRSSSKLVHIGDLWSKVSTLFNKDVKPENRNPAAFDTEFSVNHVLDSDDLPVFLCRDPPSDSGYGGFESIHTTALSLWSPSDLLR